MMKRIKRHFPWLLGIALGALATVAYFHLRHNTSSALSTPAWSYYPSAPVTYAQDTFIRETGTLISFADIAQSVLPSVVHVVARGGDGDASWYDRFFNLPDGDNPIVSAGSGVLIDATGYIVTNYHVVKDTKSLDVVLHDNRSFEATVVGTDPSTDLALLKIEGEDLRPVPMGNSDAARVGDWVLAIGNPFQLRSTVTAGIISAKGRNVNIIPSANRLSVESFIQTDAVVNKGNSGGALVNMRGELIGVNTAIFTQTGTYEGYSFAVPSVLVRKVVEDLRSHGTIQRALLGVSITNMTAERAKERNIQVFTGVFIDIIHAKSAAADAGLEEADIIVAVNNVPTPNVAMLQQQIAIRRPGDQIVLDIIRNGKEQSVRVQLKGVESDDGLTIAEPKSVQGLILGPLGASNKTRYGITDGVLLLGVEKAQWRAMGLRPGLAITHINKKPVRSIEQAHSLLQNADDSLVIEGVYADGSKAHYGLSF